MSVKRRQGGNSICLQCPPKQRKRKDKETVWSLFTKVSIIHCYCKSLCLLEINTKNIIAERCQKLFLFICFEKGKWGCRKNLKETWRKSAKIEGSMREDSKVSLHPTTTYECARTTNPHHRTRVLGHHSKSELKGARKAVEVQLSPPHVMFSSLYILEFMQYCNIIILINTKETKQAWRADVPSEK